MGWTSAAAAQQAPRFSLSWDGPPGCPTAENVQARVDALLGGAASASRIADVRASGEVERVDAGFRLLLTMSVGNAPSSRVIEARSCDELAGAAAIAIALLARSSADEASGSSAGAGTSAAPAAEGHSEPPPAAAPRPETPIVKQDSSAEPAPTRLRVIVDAPVGVAGWGSLPSAALGVGATLGIRWKALRASAGGELWHRQTHEVTGFATRFTLESAHVEACLIQGGTGLELGPCLGAAAQRVVGEGLGSDVFTARSRTAVWFSGTAGIFASLPTPGFTHLRFFGGASVLVSPSRPRFVIDQLGPVHEPALAALRLDLGCEWIF
jgi:hypothetical protein